jgi:hypothetical protein
MEDGMRATVRFQAVSNLTYTVEHTDFLGSGFWQKLEDMVATGTNGVLSARDPAHRPGRYYRLITPRQPDTD